MHSWQPKFVPIYGGRFPKASHTLWEEEILPKVVWRSSWQLGEQEIPTPSRSSSPLCLLRPAQTIILKSTKVLFWKGTSVDTTWASVNTLSQNSPEGVLGRSLVSTPPELVSTHCPILARRALVSTLLGLVSTHCPKTAQKVFWEGL
ncbi:hypothetical protein Taro_044936 [Colocasia esculenta]|uniref:Uncharacterized protein n=1 Tax=Colocasia esculenta TaxID=4460 RepID=A0A843WN41_COLES|nr:hypothetical protein [Colocasia esculenta]